MAAGRASWQFEHQLPPPSVSFAFAKAALHCWAVGFIFIVMGLDLEQMSREEKLKAMHQLWEDLARDEVAMESPAWHADALREVGERMHQGVERVHDWEDAKKELRKRME